MCGIAGILKVHPPGSEVPPPDVAIPESWLDILDESIKHRGPDGQGRFRDRATRPDGSIVDVALVHRRLAIIDLAGGQQPMVSDRGPHPDKPRNGRVAVVFNGCIYNHRELRRELQSAGHKFVTDHSDTEVLIHGWREWGHGLFAKLDGMFAVGIWDQTDGSLAVARDGFGEKPLYATQTDRETAFSSSVVGVRAIKKRRGQALGPELDYTRVASWLQYGWDSWLPYSESVPISPGFPAYSPRRCLGPDERNWFGSWGDASAERTDTIGAGEVDQLLRRAVNSRLESDVPLGVFLSGGIDSALVLLYASERRADVEAFTVRMPDSRFDESEAAGETAGALGVRHHILDCEANPAEDLLSIVRSLGLPFGDSSLLPSMWVSRAARKRVSVALGGDGGDELFLGYERHRALRTLGHLETVPGSVLRTLARALGGPSAPLALSRKAARLFDAAANRGYKDLLAIFPTSILRELIGDDSANRAGMHGGFVGWSEDLDRTALRADLMFYLPEDLLRKTDTASMSVALEVRAPFLAKELVDRMIRVRPDVLMPGGERKGLLKAVARKYLPDEIVDRPKMGFSIPIGEWFRTDYGGMKQLLLDTLNSADPFPEHLLGITINRAFVAKMVEDHMDGRRDHSQRLYMLLVLAIWADWLSRISRNGERAQQNS